MSYLWQSRQDESAEAEVHIFGRIGRTEGAERNSCHIIGSQSRAEMRKRNFTSLVVKAVWTRNFRSLAVNAERKYGNGTLDL